ncbi:MAG: OapB/ArvB family protein [Minisyncoccales bacterium]
MAKKRGKKDLGKIKGLSIQFIPFSEIRNLNSNERIKKILDIVLGNNIIILQGRLKPDEESRLIGDTMAMIGHVQDFKGIELAVISENGEKGLMNRVRNNLANIITRGEIGAVTIIGPASIVKEIKKDPKKIELFFNR